MPEVKDYTSLNIPNTSVTLDEVQRSVEGERLRLEGLINKMLDDYEAMYCGAMKLTPMTIKNGRIQLNYIINPSEIGRIKRR